MYTVWVFIISNVNLDYTVIQTELCGLLTFIKIQSINSLSSAHSQTSLQNTRSRQKLMPNNLNKHRYAVVFNSQITYNLRN